MLVTEELEMLKAMIIEGIPVDKADAIIVRYESMAKRTLSVDTALHANGANISMDEEEKVLSFEGLMLKSNIPLEQAEGVMSGYSKRMGEYNKTDKCLSY